MTPEPTVLAAEQFQRVAKALADPQRFAILERIAQAADCPCRTLVEEFPVSQATVSHHLKELEVAGLITLRRAGKCAYITARGETIDAYRAELARRLERPPAAVRDKPRAR